MKDRCIYSYTAPGADFPDYISINRRDEEITVTVRGNRGGDLAEMKLPEDELNKLIYALQGARPANLYGSGSLPPRRPVTDAPGFSVPTDSLEKAQMKGRAKRAAKRSSRETASE